LEGQIAKKAAAVNAERQKAVDAILPRSKRAVEREVVQHALSKAARDSYRRIKRPNASDTEGEPGSGDLTATDDDDNGEGDNNEPSYEEEKSGKMASSALLVFILLLL
jgi:hypothetical protein